jgi:hypothetical protein
MTGLKKLCGALGRNCKLISLVQCQELIINEVIE